MRAPLKNSTLDSFRKIPLPPLMTSDHILGPNNSGCSQPISIMKYFSLPILLAFFVIYSYGQTPVTIPKGFVETIPPEVVSRKWYRLTHSKNAWGVSIINGKLDIKKAKAINKCELKITGGTLIGIDMGEWGGQLNFIPEDPTKKAIEIRQGNINFIFNFKDKIYFMEGLAHLGLSRGAIYQLDVSNDKFTFAKLIDLGDAPAAFVIYDDKFLVATSRGFCVIQDFKKELVFKDAFWAGLYPNSIAVLDEKNVFLGIRGGIVKLDLTNRTMKFYKNN